MKKETSPYFHSMVEHINFTWKKKKQSGYFFRGRDFKELKNLTRIYPEWQVMALWDVYLQQDNNEWINENGFSLNGFYACLPWLVDDPNWKYHAKEYEKKIVIIPKEIADVLKVKGTDGI